MSTPGGWLAGTIIANGWTAARGDSSAIHSWVALRHLHIYINMPHKYRYGAELFSQNLYHHLLTYHLTFY